MTDKELLELAAKAAGIEPDGLEPIKNSLDYIPFFENWNPLEDDGDALRLAVKLNLNLEHSWIVVSGDDHYPMASVHASFGNEVNCYELKESDPYAATRRAIVNAAAEIGRGMK
jgi:hypothetical protein